jgi:hypothetical protein
MTFGNPVPGLGQAQKYIEYIEILNSITCGKQLHVASSINFLMTQDTKGVIRRHKS